MTGPLSSSEFRALARRMERGEMVATVRTTQDAWVFLGMLGLDTSGIRVVDSAREFKDFLGMLGHSAPGFQDSPAVVVVPDSAMDVISSQRGTSGLMGGRVTNGLKAAEFLGERARQRAEYWDVPEFTEEQGFRRVAITIEAQNERIRTHTIPRLREGM